MTPGLRAMVAYVASRLISGAESSFIFDFSAKGHRSMGGTVNQECVNVYDFSENCQLTGQSSNGSFELYHHGDQIHISLEIIGESLKGFDHSAGRQFSGVVRGARVFVIEEADLRQYTYWCEAPRYTRLPGREAEMAEGGLDSQADEAEPGNPVAG